MAGAPGAAGVKRHLETLKAVAPGYLLRGRFQVRDNLAGTPDKVGFAVGENKDGTCISDPILRFLYHGIVDVLPDHMMSHEDYLREWPPSR